MEKVPAPGAKNRVGQGGSGGRPPVIESGHDAGSAFFEKAGVFPKEPRPGRQPELQLPGRL